jgi:uncharacterized membrane protein YjfL (UPF0719 family)
MDFFDVKPFVNAMIYAVAGIILFVCAFFIIDKLTPQNLWKEITENKNVAVAIVAGCLMLGIALIVGMAIHG